MALFQYDQQVVETFPSIVGGVLIADGVRNGPSPAELVADFEEEQRVVLARLRDTPLSEVPSLAAWRRAFRGFGVDPTAYRSAAEALLRRLTKQGSIPSINTLVDIGNLVSMRYGLPVAVFDRRSIRDGLTVRLAIGDESFTDLGSGAVEHPEPGEVIFIDSAGHVAARRWCWRQSAESASSESTTDILVTIEGHHDVARADVEATVSDFERLLVRSSGGSSIRTSTVDAANPAVG
jgi:DNA/RNA-binding domain of Phe-tRNA-synthetase-like protein